MEKFKVGILGAGGIAEFMAKTLNQMEETEVTAIGSRTLEKAQEFADKFQVRKAYGSYEELAADPELDLIYVATPHSHHYQYAKLCLEHGKNVLCEKAFTANAKQAEELIRIAKENNVFLMEAIWTRFLPLVKTLQDLLKEETVGKIHVVSASFGFPLFGVDRLWNPNLAGGALLDLGIYSLTFASIALGGYVKKVVSDCTFTEDGVDVQNSITLHYDNGVLAVLNNCMAARTECRGAICGENGTIVVHHINNWSAIEVYDVNGKLIRSIPRPEQITGFEYEVRECIRCIREGKKESEIMPLSESLRLMKLMDEIRNQWGMVYPFER